MTNKSFLRTRVMGFTLLELLVVISIIGILTAIGAASFSVAQRQGRDARRRADMKAVQAAIEQCRVNNNSYSTCVFSTSGTTITLSGLSITDPGGKVYQSTYTETSDSYYVCSDIDGDNGNATSLSGTSFGTSTGSFFCVQNLQ